MNNRPTVLSSPARGDSTMNIRRFVGQDSRTALRQVREALGGDAIILANRSIEGGVEVLAAAPEAVDALTRRMTGATDASRPLAGRATMPITPTELGVKTPSPDAASLPGRKRLGSLFARRPTSPEAPTASAVDADTSFADALAAIAGEEDFVSRIAPEAIALSRPAAVAPVAIAPAASPIVDATPVDAQRTVIDAPVAAPTVVLAPMVDPATLSDVVAREVSRELNRELNREVTRGLERELGRDVLNDLTRDVSREVSLAVSGEVSREVTRDVTRDVAQEISREVAREFRVMQAQLTEQLATLTWTDSMRRQPGRTRLMQDLLLAGFSPALSRHVQEHLPEGHGVDDARRWAGTVLIRNLPVADGDEIIDEGGVFALVGPTGVGKTTTIAKLAARFALKHGVEQLALITTDGFRIGAQDQLRIYGKILGIPVHSIHDQASLASTIQQLANKKLVLIDTAGLGQRDERVADQIAMLSGAKAKRIVVLNATVDAETLDHIVATFADREFAGCVITKADEAARLGPVLDAVIRHRLRIHHVSTGQKVPEDLERPDAAALVHTAMSRVTEPHPAFEFAADDAPVWMAMTGRQTTSAAARDGMTHA